MPFTLFSHLMGYLIFVCWIINHHIPSAMNMGLMLGRRTSLFYIVDVKVVNYLVTISKFSIDKALIWGLEDSSVPCSLTDVYVRKMRTLPNRRGGFPAWETTAVRGVQ